jgi:hypothetical protein
MMILNKSAAHEIYVQKYWPRMFFFVWSSYGVKDNCVDYILESKKFY